MGRYPTSSVGSSRANEWPVLSLVPNGEDGRRVTALSLTRQGKWEPGSRVILASSWSLRRLFDALVCYIFLLNPKANLREEKRLVDYGWTGKMEPPGEEAGTFGFACFVCTVVSKGNWGCSGGTPNLAGRQSLLGPHTLTVSLREDGTCASSHHGFGLEQSALPLGSAGPERL